LKKIYPNKKILLTFLIMTLLIFQCLSSIATSNNFDINNKNHQSINGKNTINITFESNEYKLEYNDESIDVSMDDFNSLMNPGYPKLPIKIYYIGLPPGCKFKSFNIIDIFYEKIPLDKYRNSKL
jgi:hypothetical protein